MKIGHISGAGVEISKLFKKFQQEYKDDNKKWVQDLRDQGFKAAHPDDGYVDREKNNVYFAYPHFDDGVNIGDKIVLGWHNEKSRVVKIIDIEKMEILIVPDKPTIYYYFEEVEKPKQPKPKLKLFDWLKKLGRRK